MFIPDPGSGINIPDPKHWIRDTSQSRNNAIFVFEIVETLSFLTCAEHLGSQMREMGPCTCTWCARYESKHRYRIVLFVCHQSVLRTRP